MHDPIYTFNGDKAKQSAIATVFSVITKHEHVTFGNKLLIAFAGI